MPQPIRVTISQAANLFGISQKTIRRAIANQEMLYIVVRGVYKINFESLLKWSQSRATTRNKFVKEGIGQYVSQWKIKNRLYSPNPKALPPEDAEPTKKPKKTNDASDKETKSKTGKRQNSKELASTPPLTLRED
jgi:excisionase family DNA binding protein